jgi:hypothetical protein
MARAARRQRLAAGLGLIRAQLTGNSDMSFYVMVGVHGDVGIAAIYRFCPSENHSCATG